MATGNRMARTEQSSKVTASGGSLQAERLLECYKRGVRLSTCERNYDYAHAMFAVCVLQDPGNLKFTEGMVQNLRAQTPKCKGTLFTLWDRRHRSMTKKVRCTEWNEVFRLGIELLKANPWDITTLRLMAEACAALHFNEVELVYLKQALDAAPKNADVNRHCAKSLARMGQFDQAIACWHRVETLNPKDKEASRMISALAEEKLKYVPGHALPNSTQSTPAKMASPLPRYTSQAQALTEPAHLSQKPRARTLADYLQLAERQINSGRPEDAEAIIAHALSLYGESPELAKFLKRMQLSSHELLPTKPWSLKKLQTLPLLELGLALAVIVLAFQVAPFLTQIASHLANIRYWSRLEWFVWNVAVLLILVTIRYATRLQQSWHGTRSRSARFS